jgi:hypothetical protein
MDACALSAAQELDQLAGAQSRARSAGTTAANLNRVNLQSPDWDGKGQLAPDTIVFYTTTLTETASDAASVYVRCSHLQPDVRLWLLRAMAAFSGNTTTFPATHDVGATAVAKRGSSQTACPIPVAIKAGGGSAPPMYGTVAGMWYTIWGSRSPGSGEFGWYNLDGSTNAKATKDQLEAGVCNTRVGDTLGTPGAKTAVDEVWNYRFGIYKNNVDHSQHRPDLSGYSYTDTNWKNPPPQNAFSGTPAPGSDPSAQNFETKRANFRSFDDTGTDLRHGSLITFGDQRRLNSFQVVATPGTGGEYARYGTGDRRVATVPVIDAGNHVINYLCVLLLHPMSGPNDDVKIEVIGAASDPASPCTTNGLPGGAAGPLVPVLVR